MKTLLFCALLGTFTGLHAPKNDIMEDFEKERFTGLWYEVGIISNSDVFMKPKFSKIVGVILMGLRSEGIFTMMTYDKYGQCVLEQFSAIPMGIPGKYRIPYSREIQVLDTDYENYAILEFVFHLNKEKHSVIKLYSRTFFARPNDINTFKEFWAERDYTEDQIYMLDNDEKCTKMLLEIPKRKHPSKNYENNHHS